MPVRKLNTVTERGGVNYVRGVVEANNSVFKEQDLRHVYGHDAFVLLVEDINHRQGCQRTSGSSIGLI